MNYIKMPQFSNQILQVSGGPSDFESAISKMINAAQSNIINPSSNAFSIPVPEKSDINFSNILTDYGNGRITSGLTSLNLLSILCSGVPQDNLFLFDNVIYYSNVSSIQQADSVGLINIVLQNLGLYTIVNGLADNYTSDFESVCLSMGMDVKVGNFSIATYNAYILGQAKVLTNLYMKTT